MTAPLNLDALEAAARAATPDWRRSRAFGQLNVQDDKYMLSDADAIYAAAADPAVVLELIQRLRTAEAEAEHYRKLAGEATPAINVQCMKGGAA